MAGNGPLLLSCTCRPSLPLRGSGLWIMTHLHVDVQHNDAPKQLGVVLHGIFIGLLQVTSGGEGRLRQSFYQDGRSGSWPCAKLCFRQLRALRLYVLEIGGGTRRERRLMLPVETIAEGERQSMPPDARGDAQDRNHSHPHLHVLLVDHLGDLCLVFWVERVGHQCLKPGDCSEMQ